MQIDNVTLAAIKRLFIRRVNDHDSLAASEAWALNQVLIIAATERDIGVDVLIDEARRDSLAKNL